MLLRLFGGCGFVRPWGVLGLLPLRASSSFTYLFIRLCEAFCFLICGSLEGVIATFWWLWICTPWGSPWGSYLSWLRLRSHICFYVSADLFFSSSSGRLLCRAFATHKVLHGHLETAASVGLHPSRTST